MTISTDMLQRYIDAEIAVLNGQSYRFGDRWLTRANLPEIQKGRLEWERRVNAEQRSNTGASSTRFQTPDFT